MVKAYGEWVYIEVLRPKAPDLALETLSTGIYAEDGAGIQKVAHSRGKVISVGHLVTDLSPGNIIVFRGYLESAFRVDKNHCFININSVDLHVTQPEKHIYGENLCQN